MNRQSILVSALCGLFVVASLPDADAATIRVRCEKRVHQSKVSVDGNDLAAGSYRAKIYSGSKKKSSPVQHTVGDEVEFDFDSDPGDIAAGATAISPNFIKKNHVRGKIVNSSGDTVISDTVKCRRK